jgi:hypothetical protein
MKCPYCEKEEMEAGVIRAEGFFGILKKIERENSVYSKVKELVVGGYFAHQN